MIKGSLSAVLVMMALSMQFLFSQPLQEKINQPLIIDTDCGIEDFRAVAMILSNNAFNVQAITISDGIVPPEIGANNITGLLKTIGRESIPTGVGKAGINTLNDRNKFHSSVKWSNDKGNTTKLEPAVSLLSDILKESDEEITFIVMGPLTNIAELLIVYPNSVKSIRRIIWYKKLPDANNFYETIDSLAAKKVLNSGIRVDIISNLGINEAVFDFSFLTGQKNTESSFSKLLLNFYSLNNIPADQFNKQIYLKEEFLPLYFINPGLFYMNSIAGNRMIKYNTGFDINAIQEVLNDMINGKYYSERNIVFSKFPASREMFTYDVRQIMDSVIAKHGMEEWKASVITNEFHGHLGIYSIIGVKMGIRAREYFNVEKDILKVLSYAGYITPFSCLNDGLQVSTGATLGMNLISVADNRKPESSAEFTYKNETIRIKLKPEYAEKIAADIAEGIIKFGLMDDGYWKLVRQASLKYWLEWDRNKIFDIEKLTNTVK